MDRIKILNQAIWAEVPPDVIEEAQNAATSQPCWIVQQGNGHVVAMDGPGSPDIATGDIVYVAEVAPSRQD
jgi:hypothetical protein